MSDYEPNDEDVALLRQVADGTMKTDERIANKPAGRRMRKMYLNGYVGARPVMWIDGPPHDDLWMTEKGIAFLALYDAALQP